MISQKTLFTILIPRKDPVSVLFFAIKIKRKIHQSHVLNNLHQFHANIKEPGLECDIAGKDEILAKRMKADREKLRRDKLNYSFQELGNILDPNRHKNNKRTILVDAINILKDLTSELGRLKVENAALSEESHELIQEKSELRLEKASLKSDVDNLEVQFQCSLNSMLRCAPTDPSESVAQSISYPVALRSPSSPIPIHSPPLQSIPFLKNQSGMPSNSGSTFSPYLTLVTPCIDKPSTSNASTSYNASQQNFESKPSGRGFATELELMPGSISKKLSPRDKGKQPLEDDGSVRVGSSLSLPSSSQSLQGSSSNSMHGA